jgi:hypothetical protein
MQWSVNPRGLSEKGKRERPGHHEDHVAEPASVGSHWCPVFKFNHFSFFGAGV